MYSTTGKFSRWEYQNLALAAVTQCALLINKLAIQGDAPQVELVASINPLLVLNPNSMDEIYPRIMDLSLGLRTVQEVFSNERIKENAEIVRYTLGMLLLRNKLSRNQQMQTKIGDQLKMVDSLTCITEKDSAKNHLDLIGQDRIFKELASLYQVTISTLPYRIQVKGKEHNLKNENVTNRIRALLLAGIRSAVLWYQLGGRRWHLIFYRSRIQDTARNIRRKLFV